MFELFKIVWDIVVLNEAKGDGPYAPVELTLASGIPTVLLYEKHPQYEPLLIAAVIFDGILFICFMGWAWRWQSRQSAARKPYIVPSQPN